MEIFCENAMIFALTPGFGIAALALTVVILIALFLFVAVTAWYRVSVKTKRTNTAMFTTTKITPTTPKTPMTNNGRQRHQERR